MGGYSPAVTATQHSPVPPGLHTRTHTLTPDTPYTDRLYCRYYIPRGRGGITVQGVYTLVFQCAPAIVIPPPSLAPPVQTLREVLAGGGEGPGVGRTGR